MIGYQRKTINPVLARIAYRFPMSRPPFLSALLSVVLCFPALSIFSTPLIRAAALDLQSSDMYAANVYGRYSEIPPSLSGLIAPSTCHEGDLCETQSGEGALPAMIRYNAYVYSSSNPSGRLSASYVVDGSKALVSGFSLAYRTDGQVSSKETFSESGGGMSCERTAYAYDGLGRLIHEDRRSCGTFGLSGTGETHLSYDTSGNNVLERTGTGALKTMAYTGRDRLSESCSGSACRDPHYGPRGGMSGDGTESFVYTDAARLLSRHAGAARKDYRYLPDGLLWATQADGESGIYFYRADGELASRTHRLSTGAEEISHNFWFDGLNARTVTGSTSGDAVFDYGFSDYMESVLSERSASGATDGLRRYGHAGDPLHGSTQHDALKAWPLGYSGGYTDRLDGSHALTFFGVREQESGRFLEADTDLSQPNAYVYAADNWPNRIDMTGHAAQPVFAGAGMFGESSSATDLPTCDELNPDCQMPALPDTGGGGGHDNGSKTARNGNRTAKGLAMAGAAPASMTVLWTDKIMHNKTNAYTSFWRGLFSKVSQSNLSLPDMSYRIAEGVVLSGGLAWLLTDHFSNEDKDVKDYALSGTSMGSGLFRWVMEEVIENLDSGRSPGQWASLSAGIGVVAALAVNSVNTATYDYKNNTLGQTFLDIGVPWLLNAASVFAVWRMYRSAGNVDKINSKLKVDKGGEDEKASLLILSEQPREQQKKPQSYNLSTPTVPKVTTCDKSRDTIIEG